MYNNAGGGFIPNHHQQQQQHHQHQLHPMNQHFWALPSREGGPIQQNAISGLSVKRSLHQEEEGTEGHDKENQHPPIAKRFHHMPMGDGGDHAGGEDDEDEQEDEEEQRTKSSSSADNEDADHQHGSSSSSALCPPHQSQPANALLLTPQHNPPAPHHQQPPSGPFVMGNPLAQSTPYFGGLSLNSFPQPLDYWGGMTLQRMSSQLALVAANNKSGPGAGPFLSHQATPPAYYSNPYVQQQQNTILMANYGGGMGPNEAAGGSFSIRTNGYPSFLQHTPTLSSAYQSRDSGLGSVKVEQKEEGKNESGSSTSGGSDESANSAVGRELAVPETKFPPFYHQITINEQQLMHDLETIEFVMVPPRLALLNCNKKYQVTLAEICRRLGWPEHLNTSYLSGILRKAKNTNAGRELRERLNNYGCGFDLRTGRRKHSPVTTFTTLCEREAIQMADDFAKLASQSFPHQQLAVEMNRRAAEQSPEQRRKRLADVQNTSQILREAIVILQQGIEQETLPFVPSSQAAVMEPTDPGMILPTTMNGIKKFARLSHCFGNRTVVVAWQTLLDVFQKCEQSLGQNLNSGGETMGPSTSAATVAPGFGGSVPFQYDPNQMLMQKIQGPQGGGGGTAK